MRAVQNGAAEGVDVARVTPDKQRCDDGIERRLRRGDRGVSEGFAPADKAVVGLDLHHENFEMVPGRSRKQRMRAAHIEGKRDNKAFDRGDQHADPAERTGWIASPLAAGLATVPDKISETKFVPFAGTANRRVGITPERCDRGSSRSPGPR